MIILKGFFSPVGPGVPGIVVPPTEGESVPQWVLSFCSAFMFLLLAPQVVFFIPEI
jgi:hypothetical protein